MKQYEWTLRKTSMNSFTISVLPKYKGTQRLDVLLSIKEALVRQYGDKLILTSDAKTKVYISSTDSLKLMKEIEENNSYQYISNLREQKDKAIADKNKEEKEKEILRYFNKYADLHNSILDLFGDGFANNYNLYKLMRFIKGDDDHFCGLAGYNWLGGLQRLNAITVDGKIDFDTLKLYFNNETFEIY